ncbi:MAG TPA: phospho-sugar mutase, partial [Erysipelothrix sp.]|nr:phospho-sugar mutase [Erysipelothrix sp.]
KANMGYGKYLKKNFKGPLKVAIAYDNRHKSREFAEVSANILSTFGIDSYVFLQPRPTPELSFAIRELKCVGGIVITASHNPKEYNGYKIYDETGCQLVDHKIQEVIKYVNEIEDETSLDLSVSADKMMKDLDVDFDELYQNRLKTITLRDDEPKNIKIVFSSQHGTSYPMVPNILSDLGYDVIVVEEQKTYDPDFSNTKSPNPEDKDAYILPLAYAKKHDADLILVVDPDADRMGIAIKHDNNYVYLTGNDGGAILQEYIYSTLNEQGAMPKRPVMFNTIVTSDLGEMVARNYGVDVEKTLTGFKYIGEKIEKQRKQNGKDFVFGYEESYGYLIKPFVRDKDALQACIMVSEAANYYLNRNQSLLDVLYGLFDKHGAYYDHLESLSLEGEAGLLRIQNILEYFRVNDLDALSDIKILNKEDYLLQKDSQGNDLDYPSSNVIKYFFEDGSWIAIRPSGTEPKCKFYYNIKDETLDLAKAKYKRLSHALNDIIERI